MSVDPVIAMANAAAAAAVQALTEAMQPASFHNLADLMGWFLHAAEFTLAHRLPTPLCATST